MYQKVRNTIQYQQSDQSSFSICFDVI